MACNANKVVFSLFTGLALSVFTVTGVNAQELNLPDAAPPVQPIDFADMPEEIGGYTPQSPTFRATLGTIPSNVDVFMSVLDFNSVIMEKWFTYAGVDEASVNLGYAVRLGPAYFGFSYGGSIIDEIAGRIANRNVLNLQKREEIKTTASGTSTTPGLTDAEGNQIDGTAISEHTIGLLFGTGIFGAKLGFTAYLEGREIGSERELSYEHFFESSLKPSLELGWNFPIGAVRTKIALRGAYDIRQYISITGDTSYYKKEDTSTITVHHSFVKRELYADFTEPSGGLTMGFEFGLGQNARGGFDLIGDAAFRMYNNNGEDGAMSYWEITDYGKADTAADQELRMAVKAPEIFDLRVTGDPGFSITSDVSDSLTVGARVGLNVGYDVFTISQSLESFTINAESGEREEFTPVSTVKISASHLSLTPELGLGAKFTLWPDHFSLQAGFGIDLFSYINTTSTSTVKDGELEEVETTNTSRLLGLPTTKITAGLAVNLTRHVALDLLAINSGLGIDGTKLTLLLSLTN